MRKNENSLGSLAALSNPIITEVDEWFLKNKSMVWLWKIKELFAKDMLEYARDLLISSWESNLFAAESGYFTAGDFTTF